MFRFSVTEAGVADCEVASPLAVVVALSVLEVQAAKAIRAVNKAQVLFLRERTDVCMSGSNFVVRRCVFGNAISL
jgi:hypothetical protein